MGPLGPLFPAPLAGLAGSEPVSAWNWRLSEPSCNCPVPAQQRVCIYGFVAKIKMPRNRFSAPGPRKLMLAVHSKTISEDEVDKGPSPAPFQSLFLDQRRSPGLSSLPQAGGAGGLFIPPAVPFPRVPGSARLPGRPGTQGGGRKRGERGECARGAWKGCGGAGGEDGGCRDGPRGWALARPPGVRDRPAGTFHVAPAWWGRVGCGMLRVITSLLVPPSSH